ncbi:MAG: 6-phosphogluconolactonase [Thermoleophilaceae bacterium]
MNVLTLDDPAAEVAQRLARAASAGAHIALTGGSTPKRAYELAAELEADWSGATLWWGDERCVPADDDLSNYAMAKQALLDRLPQGDAGPGVKRIKGEAGPHGGADDYERELRDTLGEQLPRLDLVLLGLGPDAHVASLFPGQDTLHVHDRAVVGVEQAGHEPYVPRITMTLPVLNAAREVIFLVAGADKAGAVARAFATDTPSTDAPGSMVRPTSGELTLVLDDAAAAQLDG